MTGTSVNPATIWNANTGVAKQRQHGQQAGEDSPISLLAHEPDESAEQQHREDEGEDAARGIVDTDRAPEPALEHIEERPAVLLPGHGRIVEMPVLRDQPRPFAKRQRILGVQRNHVSDHERRGEEQDGQ